MCVVVAEHRIADLAAAADRILRIAGGGLEDAVASAAGDAAETRASAERPVGSTWRDADLRRIEDATGLSVSGVTVRHGAATVVEDAALRLDAGEIAALTGPNGAGKSSLLAAIAVPARRAAGDVRVDGAPPRGRAIALVPDASDDLFLRDSVAVECRHADRRAGLPQDATARRFAAFLGLDVGDPAFIRRLAQHPRDLSVGERRCLAIALQTAHRPRVLLVDEPTRGLDPGARLLVAGALSAAADAGAAVLIATHDAAFAGALGARVIPIHAGRLREVAAAEPALGREPAAPGGDATRAAASARARTPVHPESAAPSPAPRPAGAPRPSSRATGLRRAALVAANLAALAAFTWPLVASALPEDAYAAVPFIALALAPVAVLVVFAALDGSVRSAHTLALLAVLAAIGAAIRIAGTGVGGVEALFVLLILAGRAYGARFGLLLGAAAVALSAIVWGGVGPWLPFQMFACGWVGALAGLLPRRIRGRAEIALLCGYGVAASYLFGLLMNLWFWPFAVGSGTGISYVPGGSLGENLGSFLVYSLLTSTAGWDTLRAVTTVLGLTLVGRPILAALRRAKPCRRRARHAAGGPRTARQHGKLVGATPSQDAAGRTCHEDHHLIRLAKQSPVRDADARRRPPARRTDALRRLRRRCRAASADRTLGRQAPASEQPRGLRPLLLRDPPARADGRRHRRDPPRDGASRPCPATAPRRGGPRRRAPRHAVPGLLRAGSAHGRVRDVRPEGRLTRSAERDGVAVCDTPES